MNNSSKLTIICSKPRIIDYYHYFRSGELDVFVHDTPVIDYIVSQENYDCKLFKVGSFAADSYGSAFPRDEFSELKVIFLSLSLFN